MSLDEIEMPVLFSPRTRSSILLIEAPIITLFTDAVQQWPLVLDSFLPESFDSLSVSKIEKTDTRNPDHNEVLECLLSYVPGSEQNEPGNLFKESEELVLGYFELSILLRKPFIQKAEYGVALAHSSHPGSQYALAVQR